MQPIALQGELEQIRYRKSDDGLRYKHDVEGKSDLWLVDAGGKRGTLTVPRDGRPGWERDGSTYWLTNPPMRKRYKRRAKRNPDIHKGAPHSRSYRPDLPLQSTHGSVMAWAKGVERAEQKKLEKLERAEYARHAPKPARKTAARKRARPKRPTPAAARRRAIPAEIRGPLRTRARAAGEKWFGVNPARGAMSKRTTKRRATTRRKAKRPPPAGYKSWSTYMASIRPNPSSRKSSSKGGTVATRKRRRRRHTARRNPVALRSNRPAKRRRYRRNPPAFSMGGIVGRLTDAGKGALFMVGGEASTRYVRSKLLGMADGQTVSTLADAGIGVAAGLGAEKVFGRQAGRDVTAGVFAYILRSVAKQLGITALSGVLGDSGGGARYVVKNGKLVPALAGYAGRGTGRLAGYAGRGGSLTGDRDMDRIYGG